MFTYTVSDGQGATAQGTVTVSVNAPPLANPDTATVLEGSGANIIDVLSNDSDAENDSLAVSAVGAASQGSAALVNGQVTYTPNAGFFGADSFTYTVSDGRGATAQGTVTILVNAPPVANSATVTVAQGSRNNVIHVLNSAFDPDRDALAVSAVGSAMHGTVALVNGQVAYTPNRTFSGTDTFTYTVSDSPGATAQGVVTVHVKPATVPMSLTVPATLKVKGGAAVLDLVLNIGNAKTPITVTVHAEHGTFHLHGHGYHVTGNNTGTLTLSGSPAAIAQALRGLVLDLDGKHGKTLVTVTIHAGKLTLHKTIDVLG